MSAKVSLRLVLGYWDSNWLRVWVIGHVNPREVSRQRHEHPESADDLSPVPVTKDLCRLLT